VIPFPWSGEAAPPDALRGLLWSLAVRLHQAERAPAFGPWRVSGALLGRALTDPEAVSPATRRKMERRFLADLLADRHAAERAEEWRAKLQRRGEWSPPTPPRGAA
jgi:hypothetical protein